jgi:excisionase family DNA binding protein
MSSPFVYVAISMTTPGSCWDAREAASRLRLHPEIVSRMARTGRIFAVKVGREWRFHADALDFGRWIGSAPAANPRSSRRCPGHTTTSNALPSLRSEGGSSLRAEVSVHPISRKDRSRAYEVRWRENGRNRSRTFSLRKDADAWDREVARRRQLGPLAVQQLTKRGGPTLGQWIAERWAPEHGVMLAPATRERYANAYAVHMAPWLDDVPLGEVTVALLRAWQADRLKAGVSPGTIHKCRTLLSSVLRHAAESEAIPGNPLSLVRSPKSGRRDAVQPLSPMTVELIRTELLNPAPRRIAASNPGQRKRRGYELPAPGTSETRRRDALIVSLLAYAGLRPGEVRAARFGDVRDKTILVQRAANPDGTIKATKTEHHRSVRLLAPLAQDLREYRLAIGRPADDALILSDDGRPWDKTAWQLWRVDRWGPACRAVALDPVPRPYALRHSFASLLLAEGRQPLYVARQLGHSLAVLLSTYAHLIPEYEETERIDAEAEIAAARGQVGSALVRTEPIDPAGAQSPETRKPRQTGAFETVPLPGFEPGFPP